MPDAASPFHPNDSEKPWRTLRNSTESKEFEVAGPHGTTIWIEVVDFSGDGPQSWTMEFNPSHFIFGSESAAGVSLTELPGVFEQLVDHVTEKLGVTLDLRFALVQRVDLAADFELGDIPPGPIIRSHETIGRGARKKSHSYLGRHGARTLYIEPGLNRPSRKKSWKFRLYGKEALLPGEARLRVELELWPEVLRRRGVIYLMDLPAWSGEEIFRDYWEACRLGADIVAGSDLWAKLEHTVRASGRKLDLVGDAFGFAYGRDHQDAEHFYTRYLAKKHETLLAEAGCLGVDWSDVISGRLDLDRLLFVRNE